MPSIGISYLLDTGFESLCPVLKGDFGESFNRTLCCCCCHVSTVFYCILLSLAILCSYSPISMLVLLSDNLSAPLYPLLLFLNFLHPVSSWILFYYINSSFLGFLRGLLSQILLYNIFLVVTLQPSRTLSTQQPLNTVHPTTCKDHHYTICQLAICCSHIPLSIFLPKEQTVTSGVLLTLQL